MNYISADFHLHYISTYSLYVQSDLHIDHLLVVDSDENVIVYISYASENPSFEASRILSFPFEKVYVTIPQQNLIWVPSDVFDSSELNLYSDYFLDNREGEIEFQEFEDQGVTAVYQMYSTLANRWRNLFPSALIIPSFSAVLNQSLSNMDFSLEMLGIHIYGNLADIFLFVNGEMRIYNTYEIDTVDDLSFYVLSVMKNFAIEGKIQKILLSGASKQSEWGQRLGFYTKQLEELKSAIRWKSTDEDVIEAIKRLNTLADLAICE